MVVVKSDLATCNTQSKSTFRDELFVGGIAIISWQKALAQFSSCALQVIESLSTNPPCSSPTVELYYRVSQKNGNRTLERYRAFII